MAITALSDVFVPQVIGDLASDILFTKVPLLRSGLVTNASNSIWADGGNTVTFPCFDTSLTGVVQNQVSNSRTGVTPSKISMDTYTETIASKIISFDIDKNVLTDISAKADPNAHMAQVVANESAREIQSLLISKAEGTALAYDATGDSTKTLTVDNILETKMLRGEYAEDGMPVLFVHSKQYRDLAKTSDFKTLASASSNAIVSGQNLPQGTVAIVHGVAIVIMDSVTVDTGATPDTAKALMVWPNALGLWIKKEPQAVVKDVHAGSNVVTVDFDFRYAATLYRNSPRGVVTLLTNAA